MYAHCPGLQLGVPLLFRQAEPAFEHWHILDEFNLGYVVAAKTDQ